MDAITEWNKSILHIDMLERFTSNLDLLYTIGVGGAAGLIKSRYYYSCQVSNISYINAKFNNFQGVFNLTILGKRA